jgi:polyhydroxybutyrate depolymerase
MALATAGCSDAGNADPTTDTGDAEPTATASAGDDQAGTYHFEVELGDRTYDIYTPPMQDLQPLTPAVLAFHGMPGSPDTISRDSELATLADEEGFLAVFPRGESQRWEPEANGPDVDYVEALIGDLVDSWAADPDRIYVTGWSNGADMAIVSALALPDLIAGAAPVTPSGTGSVADVIDQLAAPMPVIAFIGERDGRAGTGLDMLEAWRTGAGCEESEPDDVADEVTTTSWTCDGQPFRVDVVAGQGHVWFGSPDEREPLWASEAMWDFFSELS